MDLNLEFIVCCGTCSLYTTVCICKAWTTALGNYAQSEPLPVGDYVQPESLPGCDYVQSQPLPIVVTMYIVHAEPLADGDYVQSVWTTAWWGLCTVWTIAWLWLCAAWANAWWWLCTTYCKTTARVLLWNPFWWWLCTLYNHVDNELLSACTVWTLPSDDYVQLWILNSLSLCPLIKKYIKCLSLSYGVWSMEPETPAMYGWTPARVQLNKRVLNDM